MHHASAPSATRLNPTLAQRRIPLDQIRDADRAALLVDLDGTLIVGGQAVSGAPELIHAFGDRIAVLTNNSANTPEQIARQLRRAGLAIGPDRIFTAGCQLVDTLANAHACMPVFALLSTTMKRYAAHAGVRLVKPNEAEIVAVGRMPSLTYRHIHDACNAIARGAKIIAANPDVSHPAAHGGIVPETGAIVAAIEAAAGGVPSTHFVGKPEPEMAWRALEALSCAPAGAVAVIGDNPLTDGRLASAIGARFVAVK